MGQDGPSCSAFLASPVLMPCVYLTFSSFFFSSRRRHTRCLSDWSSDVCSSDLRETRRGSNMRNSRNVEQGLGTGPGGRINVAVGCALLAVALVSASCSSREPKIGRASCRERV